MSVCLHLVRLLVNVAFVGCAMTIACITVKGHGKHSNLGGAKSFNIIEPKSASQHMKTCIKLCNLWEVFVDCGKHQTGITNQMDAKDKKYNNK